MLKKPRIGLVSGIVMIFSLFVPWTVTLGKNMIGYQEYYFEIYKFPFMAYCVLLNPTGADSWWEIYQSVPKYLGTVLMTLSSFMVIVGGTRESLRKLLTWGAAVSFLALVLFSFDSDVVHMQYAPLIQEYIIVPIGMFIPPLSWIMMLFHPARGVMTKRTSRIFCGLCGREISADFNLCPYCGGKLLKPVCPTCGKEVSFERAFCPHCGSELT
ncbi:MAG: zinc ribbon domain-containing protein [Candidatus Bathyarchaeia archaeon]